LTYETADTKMMLRTSSLQKPLNLAMSSLLGLMAMLMLPVSADVAAQDPPSAFLSDDGAECVITVDVRQLRDKPEGPRATKLVLDAFADVIRRGQADACQPSSKIVLVAATVGGLDRYGQPKWSEVTINSEFSASREALAKVRDAKEFRAEDLIAALHLTR
jgi:hypothetical protein